MTEEFFVEELKKLPISELKEEGISLCLELMASIAEVFDAAMASLEEELISGGPFSDHARSREEVRSEVVFPGIALFDSSMFILNYGRFY